MEPLAPVPLFVRAVDGIVQSEDPLTDYSWKLICTIVILIKFDVLHAYACNYKT